MLGQPVLEQYQQQNLRVLVQVQGCAGRCDPGGTSDCTGHYRLLLLLCKLVLVLGWQHGLHVLAQLLRS